MALEAAADYVAFNSFCFSMCRPEKGNCKKCLNVLKENKSKNFSSHPLFYFLTWKWVGEPDYYFIEILIIPNVRNVRISACLEAWKLAPTKSMSNALSKEETTMETMEQTWPQPSKQSGDRVKKNQASWAESWTLHAAIDHSPPLASLHADHNANEKEAVQM